MCASEGGDTGLVSNNRLLKQPYGVEREPLIEEHVRQKLPRI